MGSGIRDFVCLKRIHMKKSKVLLRSLAFLLLLCIAVIGVQRLFKVKDYRISQAQHGFYEEEKGSLDAVYVGPSHVYAFFEGPLAWDSHGIAVYPLSMPSMPYMTLKYMIKEARKTQPDAMFIVNTNVFNFRTMDDIKIHRMADYMPLSLNKIQMVSAMSERAGISLIDQLEFYFPIIRFHSGWSDLTSQDFTYSYNGLKGASVYKSFLANSSNVTKSYGTVEKVGEIQEQVLADLDDLLDYCDSENLTVLFVTVPQARNAYPDLLAMFNGVEAHIRERGYDCIDLMENPEDAGILFDCDFYNGRHANIHGALKYSAYLADYLIEHYGFSDKRGTAGYESWDEAAKEYNEIISAYTLPFEREHAGRDYGLSRPAMKVTGEGSSITVEWKPVDGADGYQIYRKSAADGGSWKIICETYLYPEDADGSTGMLSYTDIDTYEGYVYTYTVVPIRLSGHEMVYGNFNYKGVSQAIDNSYVEAVDDAVDDEEDE